MTEINLSTASVAELRAMGLQRIQTLVSTELAHDIRVLCAQKSITQKQFINSALKKAVGDMLCGAI